MFMLKKKVLIVYLNIKSSWVSYTYISYSEYYHGSAGVTATQFLTGRDVNSKMAAHKCGLSWTYVQTQRKCVNPQTASDR